MAKKKLLINPLRQKIFILKLKNTSINGSKITIPAEQGQMDGMILQMHIGVDYPKTGRTYQK